MQIFQGLQTGTGAILQIRQYACQNTQFLDEEGAKQHQQAKSQHQTAGQTDAHGSISGKMKLPLQKPDSRLCQQCQRQPQQKGERWLQKI